MAMRTRRSLLVATAGVLALLGLAPAGASALPSSRPDQSAFVTNGAVFGVARGNGLTYIGGSFTQLRAQTGGFARLSPTSGRRFVSSPEVAGQVWASAPDGAGGAYIGGLFTHVGNVGRQNIAHVLADGSVDPAFNPGANAIVRALAVSGGAVYAGGDFFAIGGRMFDNIAKLSATSGNAFSGFDANADGSVITLAVSGSAVYAGGQFTNIGGQPRNRIAKLSATSGNAFSGFDPDANGDVNTLAVSGSAIYAGGAFLNIGGQLRNRIAKLSTTSGDAFGWTASADGTVATLAVSGGAVYFGGNFLGVKGVPRNRIAKVSATSGDLFLAFDPNANDNVRGITVSGDTVYVGGFFSGANSIGGQDRNRIAKLSASSGNAFSSFNPNVPDAGAVVRTFAVSGSSVFAGGGFESINPVTRNRIAALDANGVPTAFNPNADGTVLKLAVDGSGVYAGGDFQMIGGLPRSRIAKLSAASGNAFSGFDPNADQPEVRALALSGSALYVGGDFQNIGGLARNRIAKLSTTTGNAFTGFNPDAENSVSALAVSSSAVYAGGAFDDDGVGNDSIGGEPRNHIAKLSTTTGNAFQDFNPNANDVVSALTLSGSALYAGGFFNGANSIGGQARNRIAKLSATSGNAFSTWNPNANNGVRALAIADGIVYAGGDFTDAGTIGGQARNLIAALSASSGNAFSAFNPVAGGGLSVRSLAGSPSELYMGGEFTTIGERPRQGYAQFTAP